MIPLFFLQRRWLAVLSLLAGGFMAMSAHAEEREPQGITFYVLRVIYMASDRQGVALTAYNKTPRPYLMQSRMRPQDTATGDVDNTATGSTVVPFIVTPPLSRLEPNDNLTLRIRRNGQPLPDDRESVFFISMKAIPAQPAAAPQDNTAKVILTITNNLKVFYRPEGLKKQAVAEMAPKLRFKREGNQLVADNPTPYWLTFSRLKVGTHALSKPQLRLMVPPFGKQFYALPPGATGKNVVWQLIDEDGWNTEVEQRAL
ncbi:molecular chaperone [Candidatus Symbiopectobacterium sp. NZEC127]|uniref:fimbrial biogenesis chaperone n=2 Tax=unclassified Symbiopectobacterium TaxID=2794573 RepID=UPI002225F3B4|nr:molecular chaperone [Candidatus Symbiopectobacterium sp. NZEC127]